jgi:hypothetical protein
VWTDVAPSLATALPEAELRRYLALHDWLLKRRDKRIARNPAGFLAACIANRLPFPRDFEQAQGRDVVPPTVKLGEQVTCSKVQVSGEPSDAEGVAVEKELAHLTDAERSHLEAEAVRGAKPFVVATYERLKQEGGPLFEEVRRAILIEHLKRQRLEQEKRSSDTGLREVG